MVKYFQMQGKFEFDKPLSARHKKYLSSFALKKRLTRSENMLQQRPDPVREKVKLPIGSQGEYFVGENVVGNSGVDPSIVSFEDPPEEQPSFWCLWKPSQGKLDSIIWSGETADFNTHHLWIKYLIKHFIAPWKYNLNGQVKWSDGINFGKITITNNEVEVLDLSVFS
jgi:hypothetical protein